LTNRKAGRIAYDSVSPFIGQRPTPCENRGRETREFPVPTHGLRSTS
jgi:hypothetical protein